MGHTMEHPRKALPEVAGFQAFRRGRIWGFANKMRKVTSGFDPKDDPTGNKFVEKAGALLKRLGEQG